MPEPAPVKKLYLCTSLDDLMNMASQHNAIMPKQKTGTVVNSVDKLVAEAERSFQSGDQERAFILYFRAAQLIQKHRLIPSTDQKYFDGMTGTKFNRCVLQCEDLKQQLIIRYADRENREKATKETPFSVSKSQSLGNNYNHDSVDHQQETSNRISCKELYSLVKEKAADHKVLIIDIRSSDHFQKSHISKGIFSGPGVTILNIPAERIHTMMSELEREVDVETVRELKERAKAYKVVLLDESSESLDDGTPVFTLFSLLWTYGRRGEKGEEPPVLLSGGFQSWSYSYPTFVTDPQFIRNQTVTSREKEKWQLNYVDEEEEKAPEPVTVENHVQPTDQTDKTMPLVNGNNNAISESDEEVVSPPAWNKKHPGSAQPVRSKPLVPDRSSKPEVSARGTPPKGPKIDGDSSDNKIDINIEIGEITKIVSNVTLDIEENWTPESPNVPSTLKRDNNPPESKKERVEFAPITKDRTVLPGTEVNRVRHTDRTVSESKSVSGWTQGVGPGRLSRSLSSPNINEQLENELNEPPKFDRRVKPIERTQFISRKPRHVNGIHGNTSPGLTGMRNLGMTCYINAIIQCLSNTKEFYDYFVRHEAYIKDLYSRNRNGDLTEDLAVVLRSLWSGVYKSIIPQDFKQTVGAHMPTFIGCEQQDSHEFLTMLLDKLHDELNRGEKSTPIQLPDDVQSHILIPKYWTDHRRRNDSFISVLFEGLQLSTLTCSYCLHNSYTCETFTCLSLPIRSETRCSLLDCLREEFMKTEKLETAWQCDKCKEKRDAVRRIQLCHLPRILILHLKRSVGRLFLVFLILIPFSHCIQVLIRWNLAQETEHQRRLSARIFGHE